MTRFWFVVMAVFAYTMVYANDVPSRQSNHSDRDGRPETLIYSENFENGAVGWIHVDGNIPLVNWHIYNAGGTQGSTWWMGNPDLANGANIGGYYNHQYLVLDTPAMPVTVATSNLSFRLKYHTEAPSTSDNYDGWDACNVRISTDNGVSWTVICGLPAYNVTSDYAFGSVFGEGEGVPAWGGSSDGWVDAAFSLTSYVGQSVKIRFAFASDDLICTLEQPELLGMLVDDISLGVYLNTGVEDGLMTVSSLVATGGDLWHLAVVNDAPSPSHAYVCSNADDTYNTNMLDYLYSPPVTLPSGGEIRVDFMFKGSFADLNNIDHFGWEVTPDNGAHWYCMSNPYGVGYPNYYFINPPENWISMVQYNAGAVSGYISSYAGMTVRFRWSFQTNADEPSGWGFAIDDFVVYHLYNLAHPTHLTADANGTSVILNWQAPGGGGEPGWLHYDDGENFDCMGITSGGIWDVANKYDVNGLHGIAAYVGMTINQIRFYANSSTAVPGVTYALRIYNGLTPVVVYSQAIHNVTEAAWNTVTLSTPYTIPAGIPIWIGLRFTQPAAAVYPIGIDNGPATVRYSDLYRTGGDSGVWTSLTVISNGAVNSNWNLQAYLTDTSGRPAVLGNHNATRERDVSTYHVYRDDVLLVDVQPQLLSYTDQNVNTGLHTYKITALYDAQESVPGNPAQVFMLPDDYSSVGYHDNSAEQYTSQGMGTMAAVKFQRGFGTNLKCIKVYVIAIETAAVIIRIYDDNGTGGQPGTTPLGQIELAADELIYGWNYILLPDDMELNFDDGNFYVAICLDDQAAGFGIDTSSTGHSFVCSSTGTWSQLMAGELMLSCIVRNYMHSEDTELPPFQLSAVNCPNPFSHSTTIKYSTPQDGSVNMSIYNLKGQLVCTITDMQLKAGNHTTVWNGTDAGDKLVAEGIYFCRLQNKDRCITRKMLLLNSSK